MFSLAKETTFVSLNYWLGEIEDVSTWNYSTLVVIIWLYPDLLLELTVSLNYGVRLQTPMLYICVYATPPQTQSYTLKHTPHFTRPPPGPPHTHIYIECSSQVPSYPGSNRL